MSNNCPVCGNVIDEKENWEKVKSNFGEMLTQVDMYGEDSLTENKQVLYHNRVHVECFDNLC
jgi:hypothetical protein